MTEDSASPNGQRLYENWRRCGTAVDSAREHLVAAQDAMRNAEDALRNWALPDDAKEGEKFGIWVAGDALITVTKTGPISGTVELRSRGRQAERGLMR